MRSTAATAREPSSESDRTLASPVPVISSPQPYQSMLSKIQARLKYEQEENGYDKAITSNELEIVLSIFRFAETNRPPTGFGAMTSDEVEYRAEFNTFCYYFDDPTNFPGEQPSPPTSPPRMSTRAQSCKKNLLDLLSHQKDFGPNYEPQMGWNSASGEPWLSFRCYANNAYPAISGPYNSHAREVEMCVPEFKLMYQRFRKEGYVLVWPEFASRRNLSSPSAWERFAKYRAFLSNWASGRGELQHINDACREWTTIPFKERRSVPLPVGFRLYAPSSASNEKLGQATSSSQETLQNRSEEYDSWRPEPGSYGIDDRNADNSSSQTATQSQETKSNEARQDRHFSPVQEVSVRDFQNSNDLGQYKKERSNSSSVPDHKREEEEYLSDCRSSQQTRFSLGRGDLQEHRARSRSPQSKFRHENSTMRERQSYRVREHEDEGYHRPAMKRDSRRRDDRKDQGQGRAKPQVNNVPRASSSQDNCQDTK